MKFYEIGDQPLPIKSIERDDDGDILYYFDVPLSAKELEGNLDLASIADRDVLPMMVIFSHKNHKLWDPSEETFKKGDPEAIQVFHAWETLRQSIGEKISDSHPFDLQKWEVLFKAISGEWHMLNFKDHTLPIKIMATVKYCVTDFIEKNYENIHAMSFTAEKSDHGRIALYSRFIQLIGKSLNFKSVEKDMGDYLEFVTFDAKMLKTMVIKMQRIQQELEKRQQKLLDLGSEIDSSAIADIGRISDFIDDIAAGKVNIEEVPA